MHEVEARLILEQELSRYRGRSYEELLSTLDQSETFERTALAGTCYQVEIQFFLDDQSERTIRVCGAIDDGGWRALKPLCADFIVRPDGTFVGE